MEERTAPQVEPEAPKRAHVQLPPNFFAMSEEEKRAVTGEMARSMQEQLGTVSEPERSPARETYGGVVNPASALLAQAARKRRELEAQETEPES